MTNANQLVNAIRALGHEPITVPATIPNGIAMIKGNRMDIGFPDHRLQTLAVQFGLGWEEMEFNGRMHWVLTS